MAMAALVSRKPHVYDTAMPSTILASGATASFGGISVKRRAPTVATANCTAHNIAGHGAAINTVFADAMATTDAPYHTPMSGRRRAEEERRRADMPKMFGRWRLDLAWQPYTSPGG